MTPIRSFFNKLSVVKDILIFEGLSWREHNRIARVSELVEFNKGDVICRQGSPADAFYALVSGRVYSYTMNAAGQKEGADFLLRGMHFGIISALTGEDHSHSYQAVNDSVVLKIDKDAFARVLKTTPKLALALSSSLSRKIRGQASESRRMHENVIITVFSPVKGSGSSTYAANLALFLKAQAESKRVLLLSLSADMGSSLPDLAELIADHHNVMAAIQKEKISIHVLGVKFDPGDNVLLGRISQFVSAFVNDYDHVVFDLSSPMDDVTLKILVQSDVVHLVTLGFRKDLELARQVLDKFPQALKERIGSNKVKVVVSGAERRNCLRPDKIRNILDHDIFLNLPYIKPGESSEELMSEGFSLTRVAANSEYAVILQRLSRQIGGSLIGIALGGGAALGLAHIGVIRVLEKENIPVDIITGSSMGALIGALWAVGYKADEIEGFAREFENKSALLKLFDPPVQRGMVLTMVVAMLAFSNFSLLAFLFMIFLIPVAFVPISGLIRGKAIKYWLKSKLGRRTFLHLRIPLRIVAYDLYYRREIVIDEGTLVDAVSKSIAIPGIIRPVMEAGQMIIDGGVMNPLPTNVLVDMGIKKIIAVNVLQSPEQASWGQKQEVEQMRQQANVSFKDEPLHYLGNHLAHLFLTSITPNIADIVVRTLQASEYILAEKSAKQADVLIHPDLSGINWFEIYEVTKLLKRGQEAGLKHLPDIQALVKR